MKSIQASRIRNKWYWEISTTKISACNMAYTKEFFMNSLQYKDANSANFLPKNWKSALKSMIFCKEELEILPRSDVPTILAIKHKLIALSSVIFILNYCCAGTNVIGRVHAIGAVADPGGGAEGAMAPPSPVETSHKKDGRQRRPHRFHVSWPPPYPAAGSDAVVTCDLFTSNHHSCFKL